MMSEETKIENGEDFAAMLEESFKTLNTTRDLVWYRCRSVLDRRTGRPGR